MTHVEIGITGAKRQSWDRDNPRDLLLTIIQKNPSKSEAEWLKLFTIELHEQPEYLKTVIGYWFANNVRSLIPISRQEKKRRDKHRETTKAEMITTAKRRIVEILSLSFIMPTGKELRSSTGRECSDAGGMFLLIARHLKPNETVGSKFTDVRLQKLLSKTDA